MHPAVPSGRGTQVGLLTDDGATLTSLCNKLGPQLSPDSLVLIRSSAALREFLASAGPGLLVLPAWLVWASPDEVLGLLGRTRPEIPVVFLGAGAASPGAKALLRPALDFYLAENPDPGITATVLAAVAGRTAHPPGDSLFGTPRFRELHEGLNVGLLITTPDGTIVSANRAASRLFGCAPEELVGTPVTTLYADASERSQLLREAEAEHGVTRRVFRMRRRDGREVLMRCHLHALRDATGRVCFYEGALVDTSELHRTTAARERERTFADLTFDSLPGLFYLLDQSLRFRRWNRNAGVVTGYSDAELGRASPADFFLPEDVPRVMAQIEQTMVEGYSSTEVTLVTKSGRRIPYYLTAHRFDFEGERFIVGLGIDISSRVEAQQRHLEVLERYRTLVDGLEDIVVAMAPDQTILALNNAFEKRLGWSAAEWVGRRLEEIIVADDREQVRAAVDLARASHRALAGQIRALTKARGDSPVLELTLTPEIREGVVTRVVGVARDLTERLTLEAQFRQAQKMEGVARLAGGVAHDFNNILMAISGYSDLLLKANALSPQHTEDVTEIRKAADRATVLTRQLLAFSRRQVLRPQVLSLNVVVTDMEKLLRRLIGDDIVLSTRLAPDLGSVEADAGQIEQILMNLAVNARDAMPDGGTLEIGTANVDLDQAYLEGHPWAKAGPHAMIWMTDSGVGMSKDVISHLFEPFFTTKEAGKGTGLGLATVYGIVKQSAGHTTVYSEPGLGSTFKVYLPRVDAAPQPLAPLGPQEVIGGRETVMVVDDDPVLWALIQRILREHGYTVVGARSAEAASGLWRDHLGLIDLLVTDVVMPGRSGRELATELTALRPGLKVLYMSGYTDDVMLSRGVLEPGAHFLTKPIAPDDLLRTVRALLDGQES
jgi:two-component system, cell cycle sensor histidine kinase and response regulator CckA